MKNHNTLQETSLFEQIRKTDKEGNVFWWGKDMAKILGYNQYKDFITVIEKAKTACKNSGFNIEDHFEDAVEVRDVATGNKRKFRSVKLSRYACYLIIINADPAKEAVAMGQTFFAVQSRLFDMVKLQKYKNLKTEEEKRIFLREELAKHNLVLASYARKAGIVFPADYAVFQNHGYMGLYNGFDARDLRHIKGLSKGQNILDHMGSVELAANLFRVTQAEENFKKDNVRGVTNANRAHFKAGQQVRGAIEKLHGILPEDLPVVKDIQQIAKGKQQKN